MFTLTVYTSPPYTTACLTCSLYEFTPPHITYSSLPHMFSLRVSPTHIHNSLSHMFNLRDCTPYTIACLTCSVYEFTPYLQTQSPVSHVQSTSLQPTPTRNILSHVLSSRLHSIPINNMLSRVGLVRCLLLSSPSAVHNGRSSNPRLPVLSDLEERCGERQEGWKDGVGVSFSCCSHPRSCRRHYSSPLHGICS